MSPDWSARVEPVPYAKIDNPQSRNLFSYVLNNPLNRIDPDGHYNCQGGNEQCQKFKEALAVVQKADAKLKAGTKERNRLDAVLKFYGMQNGKLVGHSGSSHRSAVALAECLCRALDRVDPPRVLGSRDRFE